MQKGFIKFGLIWFVIAVIVVCAFFLYQATQKITYIEYEKLGSNCDDVLEMSDNNCMIEQEFKIPYQMFQGISLKLGTYGRENNSRYELVVMDKTMNQQLAVFEFNTSQARDDQMYELMLDSPIKVENTHQFSIIIKAKTVINYENCIAFYTDKNIENSDNLYYNGNLCDATLCMNIYGGNVNQFWTLFTFRV